MERLNSMRIWFIPHVHVMDILLIYVIITYPLLLMVRIKYRT
uniref:ORF41c n=1 Tax=Pinus koraiensis TaxID=88728 RepID=A4QM08_PINKO|nr:ORF41c [Pinus koraiensis]